MGLLNIGGIFKPFEKLLDKFIPDKDARNALKFEMAKLEDEANARVHEQIMGQLAVNKAEASHSSIFVAGWRPFIGWVSGLGLGWNFLFSPALEFIASLFGWEGVMPRADTAMLVALVTTLLGSSGLRTYEKFKGVARSALKPQALLSAPVYEPTLELEDEQEISYEKTDEESAPWNR